jgi:uncharacterized protein YacL
MALAAQQARAARRAERQERERLSDSGPDGEATNDEEPGKRNGTEQLAGATRQAAASGEPVAGTQTDQQKEQALVDTSALIDGRIADIAQTGFVTGALIVPRFVLEELQHIADSEDALRRARGRRGLSVISRLQKEDEVSVEIPDSDVKSVHEVDAKLVKLALLWHCPIITGDFNLNQVAKLQGVKVLNINELAHALKPLMLPGEELPLQIIHEGKEAGQGVGYLDDGTMIVVHGGKPYIGTTVDVTVTRVLQTVAGRMIFAQPKQGLGAVGISTTNSGRRAEA